jgi:hypothetical protein
MLDRLWKNRWSTLALLATWLVFECWISWAAFCNQTNEYGRGFQPPEENVCIFRGPLASLWRAFRGLWSHTFDHADAYVALFTAVLVVATLALWWSTRQLWKAGEVQLSIAARGAKAAERAASAAVDAERGRLYVVIESDNLSEILRGPMLWDNSPGMNESIVTSPRVKYRLKNYGKTPAILKAVSHGMRLRDFGDEQTAESHPQIFRGLDVVSSGEHTDRIECNLYYVFSFKEAREVVLGDKWLLFYGSATFVDGFGQERTLLWKASGSPAGFNLFSYDESIPDKAS